MPNKKLQITRCCKTCFHYTFKKTMQHIDSLYTTMPHKKIMHNYDEMNIKTHI